APAGPLRLVQLFVNSIDRENDVEWLDEQWFSRHGLPGDEDLVAARTAREAIRALLIANNGRALAAGGLDTLNRVSNGVRLVVRFEDPGLAQLAPVTERPLAGILAAVYAAMGTDEWRRLKACRNCRWVFYDYSKNRSATWCSMRLCG